MHVHAILKVGKERSKLQNWSLATISVPFHAPSEVDILENLGVSCSKKNDKSTLWKHLRILPIYLWNSNPRKRTIQPCKSLCIMAFL
jgi:hypothetical protein